MKKVMCWTAVTRATPASSPAPVSVVLAEGKDQRGRTVTAPLVPAIVVVIRRVPGSDRPANRALSCAAISSAPGWSSQAT